MPVRVLYVMSDVFCRSSLSEVVSVERRLRSDALLKRDELRELVGSRYRSLLACADAIHQMSVLGQEGEEQLQALHRTLLALGSKVASAAVAVAVEDGTDLPVGVGGCSERERLGGGGDAAGEAVRAPRGLSAPLDSSPCDRTCPSRP